MTAGRGRNFVQFDLAESILIVVAGIRAVAHRYTMIYDLTEFIPWASEDEIRCEVKKMDVLTGCNCGCRGDWEIVWDRDLDEWLSSRETD